MWNRQLNGALNRVPSDFYDKVWQILERTPAGLKVAGYHLPQVSRNICPREIELGKAKMQHNPHQQSLFLSTSILTFAMAVIMSCYIINPYSAEFLKIY